MKKGYLLTRISEQGTKFITVGIYETKEEAESNIPFFKSFFYDYIIEPYYFPDEANISNINKNIQKGENKK